MKKLFENWRKYANEARIATKDGDKEVKASRGATKHFFAHNLARAISLRTSRVEKQSLEQSLSMALGCQILKSHERY